MKRGVLIVILVLVIIIVLFALVGGLIYMQFTREPEIAENSILRIELNGEIADNDATLFPKKCTIRDLWYHTRRAKIDPRIKGILFKISYLKTGLAKVEDIGRMIKDFRESGKRVDAFIEVGGLKEYFLATFADNVYVLKGGTLFLNGLAAEAIFLKSTLAKLGIKAEFFHLGEYKTAANTFTEDGMTPAHREAMQTLLDHIFAAALETIAQNRGIKKEVVRKVIEAAPFSNRSYLESGLIDKELYEDEIVPEAKGGRKIIDFHTYKETSAPVPYEGAAKMAVIFACGEIRSGGSGQDNLFGGAILGSDTLSRQLRAVRKSAAVKAVVLRIDSPGGSPFASEVIRREIELLVKKKPLVISMSDVAASGAYWLSLPASKIIALPQTITGSIGIVGGKFVLKELYDKIGLKKTTIKTSKYADMFSDYRHFSPGEKERYVGLMREIYDSFLEKVASSRHMKIKEVDRVARGRVWAGSAAVRLNLVDQAGGLLDAIREARRLAKIPESERLGIKIYPGKKSLWDRLQEFLGAKSAPSLSIGSIEAKLESYKKIFPALLLPYRIRVK